MYQENKRNKENKVFSRRLEGQVWVGDKGTFSFTRNSRSEQGSRAHGRLRDMVGCWQHSTALTPVCDRGSQYPLVGQLSHHSRKHWKSGSSNSVCSQGSTPPCSHGQDCIGWRHLAPVTFWTMGWVPHRGTSHPYACRHGTWSSLGAQTHTRVHMSIRACYRPRALCPSPSRGKPTPKRAYPTQVQWERAQPRSVSCSL